MTALATVYVVFADAEEAHRIAEAMISADLAACANILAPCQSIFRWNGKLETAAEVPALFKTIMEKVEPLVAAIAAAHSYEVPAITVWPIIQAGPGYAEWIASGQAPGFG